MRTIVLLCLLLPGLVAAAPAVLNPFSDAEVRAATSHAPADARQVRVDLATLAAHVDDLAAARVALALPLPEGGEARFLLEDSGTLPPELAARYPGIHSLRGRDSEGRRLRLDFSPGKFDAMVFEDGRTWVIVPASTGNNHVVYDRAALPAHARQPFACGVDAPPAGLPAPGTDPTLRGLAPQTVTGTTAYSYRLAVAATGEYTQFHGGTVAAGLAAIVVVINRVNEIYEADVGVHMTLVANNDLIIYTDGATDPYTNNSGSAMLSQNQTNLDAVIGSPNYDVGHVFSTGGGGIASLSVVCANGSKARGVTGRGAPVGDPFSVDYVAHEIGHQFGAHHTFNGTASSCSGNRSASSAYEPGSGSTVMAYAGICGAQNLQPNSDPYFHARSIDAINGTLPFDSCADTSTPDNTVPQITAPGARTIPARTPFRLFTPVTDADGDLLRHTWEQYDLGPAQSSAEPLPTTTTGPMVRSFDPTLDPERIIPRLDTLLGAAPVHSEVLPEVSRSLRFRLTVRDDAPGAGATASADINLTVVDTGSAFALTAPGVGAAWTCNAPAVVEWTVAGTDAAPINCAAIDLDLSLDGGVTFPHLLAAGLPNTGWAEVLPPDLDSSEARLRASCSNNIFFALSPADFSIEGGEPTVANDETLDAVLEDAAVVAIPVAELLGNDQPAGSLSLDAVAAIAGGSVTLDGDTVLFVPEADFNGFASWSYTVSGGCGGSASATATLPVLAVNDAPSMTLGSDVQVVVDQASGSVAGFVGNVVLGPANEAHQQVLGYEVTTLADPTGVVESVAIDTTGTLSWTLTGAPGLAQFEVVLQDDGGTENGGVDLSEPKSFSIVVLGAALFRDSFETD